MIMISDLIIITDLTTIASVFKIVGLFVQRKPIRRQNCTQYYSNEVANKEWVINLPLILIKVCISLPVYQY